MRTNSKRQTEHPEHGTDSDLVFIGSFFKVVDGPSWIKGKKERGKKGREASLTTSQAQASGKYKTNTSASTYEYDITSWTNLLLHYIWSGVSDNCFYQEDYVSCPPLLQLSRLFLPRHFCCPQSWQWRMIRFVVFRFGLRGLPSAKSFVQSEP